MNNSDNYSESLGNIFILYLEHNNSYLFKIAINILSTQFILNVLTWNKLWQKIYQNFVKKSAKTFKIN